MSRAAPISECTQISGSPARNRMVFINRRHLKGVVRSSLEKRQAALEHKARSAKPEFRAVSPSAPQPLLELMKTTRFLAVLPLEIAFRPYPFPIEGCEAKGADIPLLMRRRLNKSQNHAHRARQIGKPEASSPAGSTTRAQFGKSPRGRHPNRRGRSFPVWLRKTTNCRQGPMTVSQNAARLLEERSRASKEKVLNALLWGYGAYASSLREQQKG